MKKDIKTENKLEIKNYPSCVQLTPTTYARIKYFCNKNGLKITAFMDTEMSLVMNRIEKNEIVYARREQEMNVGE